MASPYEPGEQPWLRRGLKIIELFYTYDLLSCIFDISNDLFTNTSFHKLSIESEDQQKATIDAINEQETPSVYIRHQYFINFENFGEKSPLYMNVIRDPIR